MDVEMGYQCQKTSNINIMHKIFKFEMPFVKFTTVFMSFILNRKLLPQSSHRVEIATFNGVHSIAMENLAQPGEGGVCTPISFHCIFHRVLSCGVFLLYPYMYSVAVTVIIY
jgi:hypothetical protein